MPLPTKKYLTCICTRLMYIFDDKLSKTKQRPSKALQRVRDSHTCHFKTHTCQLKIIQTNNNNNVKKTDIADSMLITHHKPKQSGTLGLDTVCSVCPLGADAKRTDNGYFKPTDICTGNKPLGFY